MTGSSHRANLIPSVGAGSRDLGEQKGTGEGGERGESRRRKSSGGRVAAGGARSVKMLIRGTPRKETPPPSRLEVPTGDPIGDNL